MLEDRLTTARAKVDELNRRLGKIEDAKTKLDALMTDFEAQLEPAAAPQAAEKADTLAFLKQA